MSNNITPLESQINAVSVEAMEQPMQEVKPQRGRPKGSKNRPKIGRPKGSRNKIRYSDTNVDGFKQKESLAIKDITELYKESAWAKYVVKHNDKIEDGKPVLTFGGKSFVSAGGLSAISGKAKSCKTFFTSALITAYLNGEYMGIASPSDNSNERVLIADTEQGKTRTQSVIHRVQGMSQLSPTDFDKKVVTLCLREINAKKRADILLKAIADIQPKLVIIDGVRDLIDDFNNITESANIVGLLMKTASELDCAIVVVIHLNKGDENTRGHLGSELSNKCETVAKLTPERNGSIAVSPALCRDVPFDEFAFRISEDGEPISCELQSKRADKESAKLNDLRKLFWKIFDEALICSPKELYTSVAKEIKVSEKTAQRRVELAVTEGIIEQLPTKEYVLTDAEVERLDKLEF